MLRPKQPNPFEVLGVGPEADDQRVKDAFRAAAMGCHPDKKPEDEQAAVRFAEVKSAYERIKTVSLRRSAIVEYGMMTTAGGHDDLAEAFSGFYKTMDSYAPIWSKRYTNVPLRGANVTKEVSVTLEQAYRGGRFSIEHPAARCGGCHGAGRIPRPGRHQCPTCNGDRIVRSSQSRMKIQIECPTCVGRGAVHWVICTGCGGQGQVQAVSAAIDLPRGVVSGQEIVLRGYGSPGVAGGAAGDLLVKVRILDHPTFSRQGDDLLHRIHLDVWDAALGIRRSLRGIDGGLLEYQVLSGCQPGSVIRIEDGGMPGKDGGKGALLLTVEVRIPDAGRGTARDMFLWMKKELGSTSEP